MVVKGRSGKINKKMPVLEETSALRRHFFKKVPRDLFGKKDQFGLNREL